MHMDECCLWLSMAVTAQALGSSRGREHVNCCICVIMSSTSLLIRTLHRTPCNARCLGQGVDLLRTKETNQQRTLPNHRSKRKRTRQGTRQIESSRCRAGHRFQFYWVQSGHPHSSNTAASLLRRTTPYDVHVYTTTRCQITFQWPRPPDAVSFLLGLRHAGASLRGLCCCSPREECVLRCRGLATPQQLHCPITRSLPWPACSCVAAAAAPVAAQMPLSC